MWKILQRATRCHWGRPAPQIVCRDDVENKSETACGPAHISDTSPVLYIHRRNYHNDRNKESDGQKERTTNTDWDEWMRSFRRDFSSASGHPYSAIEAVGWGSALVLGIQLTQYYNLTSPCTKDRYKESNHWTYHLHHVALGMPNIRSTVLSNTITYCLLPQPASIQKAGTSIESVAEDPRVAKPKERDKETHWEEILELPLFDDKRLKNDAEEEKSLHTPQQQTPADPFVEARKEWMKLNELRASVGANLAACQHTKLGDFHQAMTLWKQSASGNGYAKASFNLGLCYELGKGVEMDLSAALEHYKVAAAQGHDKAMYNLAVLYLKGEGGIPKNLSTATELLEKAAEMGLKRAQTDLGVLCLENENCDMTKAASLFEMASSQQDPSGQYFLAVCYENGWGVEENACKAAELYKNAGEAGHAGAQYNMGAFFEQGMGGLPVDKDSALSWYQQAADNGYYQASKEIHRLKEETNPEINFDEIIASSSYHDLHETKEKSLERGSSSSPALGQYMKVRLLLSSGFADMENHGPISSDVFQTWMGAHSKDPQLCDKKTRSPVTFYISDSDSDLTTCGQDHFVEKETKIKEQRHILQTVSSNAALDKDRNALHSLAKTGSFGTLPKRKSATRSVAENLWPREETTFRNSCSSVDITFDSSPSHDGRSCVLPEHGLAKALQQIGIA